jgi:CubicO group peptidase (beta-lactamase class C family)
MALLVEMGLRELGDEVGSVLGVREAGGEAGAQGDDWVPGVEPRLAPITVLNLLLHNAGFGPDPVPFFNTPEFGCPATREPGVPLDFSCVRRVWASVASSPLPNAPIGSTYVYSDLSFITLHYLIGATALEEGLVPAEALLPRCVAAMEADPYFAPLAWSCYHEAFVRLFVFDLLNLGPKDTLYLPPPSLTPHCAPTTNDTTYRHRVVQGQVQDQNTYAMGGISGHAGVFATAPALAHFLSTWLYSSPPLLSPTTISLFTTEYNHSQSSRALGWNTNDYSVNDEGWDHQCGTLSASTYMHIGFTGPMLCADPVRQLGLVLTTNRVYPNATNEEILVIRRNLSTAIATAYDEAIDRL